MGFASYYEDNLEARDEFVRGRHRLTSSSVTHTPQPKQSPKPLQQKALYNTGQDIRRREFQKTQHASVMKTQYVTTEEIQRRIQREMIRQSRLKE